MEEKNAILYKNIVTIAFVNLLNYLLGKYYKEYL